MYTMRKLRSQKSKNTVIGGKGGLQMDFSFIFPSFVTIYGMMFCYYIFKFCILFYYITHKIYYCKHFKSSMASSIVTLLHSHHHRPSPELFHLPQLKPCTHLTPASHPHLPSAPGTTLTFSMNLMTLGISKEWNHTVFVLS